MSINISIIAKFVVVILALQGVSALAQRLTPTDSNHSFEQLEYTVRKQGSPKSDSYIELQNGHRIYIKK